MRVVPKSMPVLPDRDSAQRAEEIKKLNEFFKRKRLNPYTLYNTLNYIAPLFASNRVLWEKFVKLMIEENGCKRPDYERVQVWFVDACGKSLNISETKYLCRYVAMCSLATECTEKLAEVLRVIQLPPPQDYESWVYDLYDLEYQELVDSFESEKSSKSPNYIKNVVSKIASVFGLKRKVLPGPRRKTCPSINYTPDKKEDNSTANRVRRFSASPSLSSHF